MAIRNSYDYSVDEKMRSSTKTIQGGNPNNLSYWKKVKILDASYSKYSAESLRAHWLLLMKRDRNLSDNEELLHIKNYDDVELQFCVTPQPNRYEKNSIHPNGNNDYLSKTERAGASDIHGRRKNEVQLRTPSRGEIVKKDSNHKIMKSEKIDEVFENLIDICRLITQNRELSEKEIVKVLVDKRGKISEVIKCFITNNIGT